MSIAIKNLFMDTRDVGKTIKGTKKYFVWEFVLNGKYHKVEVFHSKVSGKKKLCVDAQVICEDKSYKNDFTYSFKVDKNYLNVVQINSDKFEMRIDNRAFEILIQEERTGKLRVENTQQVKKQEEISDWNDPSSEKRFSKFEQTPSNLRSNARPSNGSLNNPRNSDAGNFFNDGDFDFNNDNNNNRNMKNFQNRPSTNEKSINSFSNFSEFTNKFSNSNVNSNNSSMARGSYSNNNQRSNTNPVSNQNQGLLVDFNDIIPEKKKVTDNKEVLNQINFDLGIPVTNNSTENNFDVFNHNKNVLNNLSIPNVDDDFRGIPNTFSSGVNTGNNLNNIENIQNVQQVGNFNNFNMSSNGFIGNHSVQNTGNVNVNFFDSNINNLSNTNTNSQNRYNNVNVNSSNNFYSPISNSNDFTLGESLSGQNTTSNLSLETGIGNNSISGNNQETNDFKKKILGSGLVNIDNLFEDKKKSNTTTNSTSNSNYNFGFNSGGIPINYMNDKTTNSSSNFSQPIYNNNFNTGTSSYPMNMMSYSNNMGMGMNNNNMGYGLGMNSINQGMNMGNGMGINQMIPNMAYNQMPYGNMNPSGYQINQNNTNITNNSSTHKNSNNTPFDF